MPAPAHRAAPSIRPPGPADAPALRDLVEQLGHRATTEAVVRRLAVPAGTGTDPVLVAGEDRVLGLIAAHWTPMRFAEAPIARITTLAVDESARGLGAGRRLAGAIAALARRAGRATLEVTTATHRADARACYESVGCTVSSRRRYRPLPPQDG